MIKNGQSRETDNIDHKTQDEDTQNKKHNTICVGHNYTQTNTNNVNKTWVLLKTTGGEDIRLSFLYGNRNWHHNMELRT